MCGIAGIIGQAARDPTVLARMAGALTHRGPDDEGFWTDLEAGVGLAHRRLSIVDLSPAGHQPMTSNNGRWVITLNGEIYNYPELKAELEASGGAPNWRGHSDTEVLIECIAAWGFEATLKKCVGMFALALWDRRDRMLHLARDRFGEKPLYYGWVGGNFLFGSELKALRVHPGFDNAVDRRALALLAARTYIPAPLSIYRDIYKLQPGCILTVGADIAGQRPSSPPKATPYWSYRDAIVDGLRNPISDEQEALEQLEQLLSGAIRGQSMADVPVGAFLSGGIDSSTVVALYQKYSSTPVRTFSMGFAEAGFNEAEHAKKVAQHFGTVHNERYVTVEETQSVIPLLPAMYDEPFADSSQIPTHLVSRFAREQVTVALSGDGGDELFAGYHRHFSAPALWKRMRLLPRPARKLLGSTVGHLPADFWNIALGRLAGQRQPHFGAKIRKGLRVAGTARSFDDVYASFLDEWAFERSPVLGVETGEVDVPSNPRLSGDVPDTVRTMYCDAITYLPDDILCKVDRASMAVSLETRVPFLDHRVAEFAARIPLSMKVRNGRGKHVLRQLLDREGPATLFDRPKAGFAVPVGQWLRGPLRPWAEDLLDRNRLSREGFFNADAVGRRWRQHLSGQRDSTPAIWAVLMFQAWKDEQT
jgi:asparagine synthase (glutamine-hydrolysing)